MYPLTISFIVANCVLTVFNTDNDDDDDDANAADTDRRRSHGVFGSTVLPRSE